MDDVILKMQHISKTYGGIKALDNVELEVQRGEILCLLGENGAGKSTLMKILSGVVVPNQGAEIVLDGQKVDIKNPNSAHELGISIVHQELIQFPDMNIMENIYVGRYPRKNGLIDYGELEKRTRTLMEELGIYFDPKEYIRNLSVAQRQLVEIMKALSFQAKIIIFDEPTSSLTSEETTILFSIIQNLKEKGISQIYISHRLEDIFAIGDRITVLRDGQNSGGGMVKDLNSDQVVSLMVGRNIENQFPKERTEVGEEILRVEHIQNDKVKDVSFTLRRGEVLGFGGLVGAGRTELMRAVMGLDKCTGSIYKNGKELKNANPMDAIQNGFAMVPEDRKDQGLVLLLSILNNIEMSSLKTLSHAGFMNASAENACVDKYAEQLHIKMANKRLPASSLSGGNQQKVVIAKCLATEPEILILDEPTRGIDVGSKAEIYQIINDLAKKGVAVIIVSSELPELLNISDRIIVMREGFVTGEIRANEADEESVMKLATKGVETK